MRTPSTSLGSTFQKLDTHTTAADSFLNVRDMAVLRNNHNLLVARAIRRQLFSFVYADSGGNPMFFKAINRLPTRDAWPIFWFGQVLLSQWTAQIKLVFEAAKTALNVSSSFTDNPAFKARLIQDPGIPNYSGLTSVSVTAASGAPAKYSLTLDVPQRPTAGAYWHGFQRCWLLIYADTPIDTTYAVASAVSVTAIRDNVIVAAVGNKFIGDAMYLDSLSNVAPRQIASAHTIGATLHNFLDYPFAAAPTISTDTVTVREIQGIEIYSMSGYELPVTDLSQRDEKL